MKKVTDLKENECIHCKTKEEANAICKLMHDAGLKWCDCSIYLDYDERKNSMARKPKQTSSYNLQWWLHKENTVYYPFHGQYSILKYAIKHNHKVYPASDFIKTSIDDKIEKLQNKLDELKYQRNNNYQIGDIVVHKEKSYVFKIDEIIKIHGTNYFLYTVNDTGYYHHGSQLRKATPEEIQAYKNKLPKIGCQEGVEFKNYIEYGSIEISKRSLIEMQKAGIKECNITYDGEDVFVSKEDLEQIYKIAER